MSKREQRGIITQQQAEIERLNKALDECEGRKEIEVTKARIELIEALVVDKNAAPYRAGKRDGAIEADELYHRWLMPYIRLVDEIAGTVAMIDLIFVSCGPKARRAVLRGLNERLSTLLQRLDVDTQDMIAINQLSAGDEYERFLQMAQSRFWGVHELLPIKGDKGESLRQAIEEFSSGLVKQAAEKLIEKGPRKPGAKTGRKAWRQDIGNRMVAKLKKHPVANYSQLPHWVMADYREEKRLGTIEKGVGDIALEELSTWPRKRYAEYTIDLLADCTGHPRDDIRARSIRW